MNRRQFILGSSAAGLGLMVGGLAHAAKVSTVFSGNTDSKIFHKTSCRYYSCKACTKTFTSKKTAVAAGY